MEAEAAVDAAVTVASSDHLPSPIIAQDPPVPLQPSTLNNHVASTSQNAVVPAKAEAVVPDMKPAALVSRKRTAPSATPESQAKPKKPRMTIGIDTSE